jgi:hypothetical protein
VAFPIRFLIAVHWLEVSVLVSAPALSGGLAALKLRTLLLLKLPSPPKLTLNVVLQLFVQDNTGRELFTVGERLGVPALWTESTTREEMLLRPVVMSDLVPTTLQKTSPPEDPGINNTFFNVLDDRVVWEEGPVPLILNGEPKFLSGEN